MSTSRHATEVDLDDIKIGPVRSASLWHDLGRSIQRRFSWLIGILSSGHAAIGASVFAFVLTVGRIAIGNHYGLGSYGYDVGIFDQGVWLMSRFEDPFVTVMGRHLLGDHTSFILIFLVPLYWIFDTAAVLIWSQTVLLAVSAVPLYFIALRVLGSRRWAWLLATAYLFSPAIVWSNLDQFHPEAFYPLLLACMFLALMKGKHRHVLVLCLLVLAVKEDAFLIALPIAVYVASLGHRRLALQIAIMTLSAVLINFFVVIPTLLAGGFIYSGRMPFGGVGGTIETAIKRPGELLDYIRSDNRLFYVWQLLAPLALLSLLARRVLLVGAGVLALNIMSEFGYMHRIEFHYSLSLAMIVAIAAVYGVAAARQRLDGRWVAAALSVACVWSSIVWGPYKFSADPFNYWSASRPEVVEAREAARLIPADASVAAEYSLVPLVSQRREIYMFPSPFKAELYGRFDREDEPLPQADTVEYVYLFRDIPEAQRAVWESRRGDFEQLYAGTYVELYRRR